MESLSSPCPTALRVCVCVSDLKQLVALSPICPRQDPGGVAWPGYGEKGGSSEIEAWPQQMSPLNAIQPPSLQVRVVTVLVV